MSTNKTWLAAFATLMLAAAAFAADFPSYLKIDGTKKAARLLYGLRETAFITRESHAVKTASKAANAIPLPTAK